MAQVSGVFAELERALIGERTRAALAAKRASGTRLGRPVSLSEDIRKRIAALRAEGLSLRAIAERLNEEGVSTAHGGALWYASTVGKVLRSLELDAMAGQLSATG
jgi:DNA invertase Pin-like site-specific DNA recombinase